MLTVSSEVYCEGTQSGGYCKYDLQSLEHVPAHPCSARNKDQKLVGRFLKIRYFIGYYTAVPLKMYGDYGRSK